MGEETRTDALMRAFARAFYNPSKRCPAVNKKHLWNLWKINLLIRKVVGDVKKVGKKKKKVINLALKPFHNLEEIEEANRKVNEIADIISNNVEADLDQYEQKYQDKYTGMIDNLTGALGLPRFDKITRRILQKYVDGKMIVFTLNVLIPASNDKTKRNEIFASSKENAQKGRELRRMFHE